MGKHEFLTPKAIANRIKAKGLQRLRWYCQICEKQCRDENGFKCHCLSESHQRQMEVFSHNPSKFMNNYTSQFKQDFLELLKRRFGERRVFANMVYQEYIKDREHIHMNATIWATLSDFVKYLGREGICTVEDTEQGWYITYIDRTPETLARWAAKEKKEQTDLDEEERHKRLIEKQIQRARREAASPPPPVETLFKAAAPESKLTFHLEKPKTAFQILQARPSLTVSAVFRPEEEENGSVETADTSLLNKKHPVHRLTWEEATKESLAEGGVSLKKRGRDESAMDQEPDDSWLHTGLIVRVTNRTLAQGIYYKKKGKVAKVFRTYVAQVTMLDSGDVLRLDQEHVEPVVPEPGEEARIVRGVYRGNVARVEALDDQDRKGLLCLQNQQALSLRVKVAYNDFCKISREEASSSSSAFP